MIGKRVLLRALEPDDVEILYKLENNREFWHLSNTITPFSRFVLEQYILNSHQDIYSSKQLRLMIDYQSDDENIPVGMIDLYDFDPVNLRAGIGILIDKSWQGKGIASEALDLLIDYAFNTLHLHQLYCGIGSDNVASLKLFQKHGFKTSGKRDAWIRHDNQWVDELFLQLINPEN